jgi:Tfp pilus assembly protein PilV
MLEVVTAILLLLAALIGLIDMLLRLYQSSKGKRS